MREANLYGREGDGTVVCHLCPHRCKIRDGKSGICSVRVNREGTLYADSYAKVAAEAVDPVEKKPLNHFLPGTQVYSLGGVGCNFRCRHCQNWRISQVDVKTADYLRVIEPEEGVRRALAHDCSSIAWTYNEPTIWHEYCLDMGIIAKEKGLRTIYVTNGYITGEALAELSGMLDAFRVDIKAFTDDFYRKVCCAKLQPVLDATIMAKEAGMHIEVVNLVIPGLNDSEDEVKAMIKWIYENLGEDTPVHFTRFHPDYNMTDIPATPLAGLEKIYRYAKEGGLRYPYIGNVAGHEYTNTYCHNCGSLLIERVGFMDRFVHLDGDECGVCGEKIPIVL